MSPSKMDLYRLSLIGPAEAAAAEIASQHPDCVFTSGKRSREEQAHAMASNVVRSPAHRQWINRTYKQSRPRDACQQWVDDHPGVVTVDELADGLLAVMETFTPEQLGRLSKHMSGEAFDVQPMFGLAGQILLQDLRAVVRRHGGTLLEREGGLVRWHAQF